MTKLKRLIKKAQHFLSESAGLYKVRQGIPEIYAKPDVLRSTRRAVSNYLVLKKIVVIFVVGTLCWNAPVFALDCFPVEHVFDGDTISAHEQKIRLLGIDAYEYDQLPYGKTAKDFLTKLVLGKKVCIETDVEKKDIYERTLGYVFLDKVFVNEELLKNGQAILYNFPPNVKYLQRLKKAQIYARENMLGIWEKENYIKETPYQHRHKK